MGGCGPGAPLEREEASEGEEIKKEIVSSRCFKLPFITTHKPGQAPEKWPTSGHLVPPMADAGSKREREWKA